MEEEADEVGVGLCGWLTNQRRQITSTVTLHSLFLYNSTLYTSHIITMLSYRTDIDHD
jgi:hypothetical protein